MSIKRNNNYFMPPLPNPHYKSAYRQIVLIGKVSYPIYKRENLLPFRDIEQQSTQALAQQLYDSMEGKPLSWPLLNRCLSICRQFDIYPDGYELFNQKPVMPTSVYDALNLLTDDQIVKLLRSKKMSTEGTRIKLMSRITSMATMEHFSKVITPIHEKRLAQYEINCVLREYELLVEMIHARAHFYQRIRQLRTLASNQFFSYEFELSEVPETEQHFARVVDGFGYTNVLEEGRIQKFLPIYPGATMTIKTSRVTKR